MVQPFAKVNTVSLPLWQQAALQLGAGLSVTDLAEESFSALFEKAVQVMRPTLQEQTGFATDQLSKQRFAVEFARNYWGNLPPVSHVADRLVVVK